MISLCHQPARPRAEKQTSNPGQPAPSSPSSTLRGSWWGADFVGGILKCLNCRAGEKFEDCGWKGEMEVYEWGKICVY